MNTQRDEARIANTKRGNEHIAERQNDDDDDDDCFYIVLFSVLEQTHCTRM